MIVDSNVENYIRSLSSTKDSKLLELEKYAKENHVPIIEAEVANFLNVIVSLQKPKRILELGTAIGYSSIIMNLAYRDAKIITLEKNKKMVEIAKKNIMDFEFSDSVDVVQCDAYEYLLDCDEKFDMIFIDAAKGQYLKYFEESMKLINDKGIIVCDNVLFKGMVCDEEALTKRHRKITIVKRLNEFLEYISNLEEYKTSIIPIDDGMSISYKI
ncbi:O-methyltransferase [Mediannikoviicoccus vaginalis]|uniref:O-methyltransferase n=1 Tax=Mediannikoviicoccus vaginalis TaxID=2899727 RepID=UPI001F2F0A53|nr:O-methyltransferase [Mediannikoviicoccus vaginalis]